MIELAVMTAASMRLTNHIIPLGQFTKLFGNPVRFGKRGSGIADSRPTELLSDCVNRSVYSPSQSNGKWMEEVRHARVAIRTARVYTGHIIIQRS